MTQLGELDLSSLWSWTIPLWSLFLILLFLVGVAGLPIELQAVAEWKAAGGGAKKLSRGN